ncbi:hypothetical protein BaRGS_00003523 [Batillaria attramentaria]|uniref:Uncharacterized protein n=1 Tax=Batillaria attramentaria TaxID=370345 RepID=A0ABD0M0Z4_9CAEN
MLHTRVPRRLLTLPWYDNRSPLSHAFFHVDWDAIYMLFHAGIANHRDLKHMCEREAQREKPSDEETAGLLHHTALKQFSSRPRMLQDICLHTVVRSLDHLTKPSERNAAFESLELNPGVWRRIVNMKIAFSLKGWESYSQFLFPPVNCLRPCTSDENMSDDISSTSGEENTSCDSNSSSGEENMSCDSSFLSGDENMPCDSSFLSGDENMSDDINSLSGDENVR